MAESLKGSLWLGLAGGIAGTALMGAYWGTLSALNPASNRSGEEPTTVRVARRGLRLAGVKSPSKQTRTIGGEVVHWGYGAGWGLVVGLAREAGVRLDWGGGLLLGAGLWVAGDVWMLYALRLAKHPREYPVSVHANALGAHLTYGLGLWAAMEGLHRLQPPRTRFLRRVA